MTAVVGVALVRTLSDVAFPVALLGTFVIVAYSLALILKGPPTGTDVRTPVRRVMLGALGAWALCLAGTVLDGILFGERLAELGPRTTPSDRAGGAAWIMAGAATGTACLLIGVAAAGALALAGRGRSAWAGAALLGAVILVLALVFAGSEEGFQRKWSPNPRPEGVRIHITHDWSPAFGDVPGPLGNLLLLLAALAVLPGLVSTLLAARGKRPWPCPPTDDLLFAGTAAGVLAAVLLLQAAYVERAWAHRIFRVPGDHLIDDFLRAAAPAAVVAWAGLWVLLIGRRGRGRGRGVDGGEGR